MSDSHDADLKDDVEIRPVDDLVPYGENPKEHPTGQVDKIASSIRRFGWDQPIVVDGEGTIIKGHGRYQAAQKLNLSSVPVIEQAGLTDTEARAARIADNRVSRSDFDEDLLAMEMDLLEDDDFEMGLLGFEENELRGIGAEEPADEQFQPSDIDPEGMSSRESPIDAIITIASSPAAEAALDAGFKLGFQSGSSPTCADSPYIGADDIIFVDNPWEDYDHDTHLQAVREYRPTYATTRDIISQSQADQTGVEYYSVEKVLRQAEELGQYADNIIVIPKVDVIDEIPDRHVLGYSVPTSHGGTEVPVNRFRGHDIHLLGGGWTKQLQFMDEFGSDVVALDNNYINKIAPFGQVRLKNGDTRELSDFGFTDLTNPRLSALTLSFGSMMSKLQDLHPGQPGEATGEGPAVAPDRENPESDTGASPDPPA